MIGNIHSEDVRSALRSVLVAAAGVGSVATTPLLFVVRKAGPNKEDSIADSHAVEYLYLKKNHLP